MFLHVHRLSENIRLVRLPSLPERTRDELLQVTSGRTMCSDCLEVHHAVGGWGSPGLVGGPGSQLLPAYARHCWMQGLPQSLLAASALVPARSPFPRGAENSQLGAFSPIFPGGTQDSPSLLHQESSCLSRTTSFPEPTQAKSLALGFSLLP